MAAQIHMFVEEAHLQLRIQLLEEFFALIEKRRTFQMAVREKLLLMQYFYVAQGGLQFFERFGHHRLSNAHR